MCQEEEKNRAVFERMATKFTVERYTFDLELINVVEMPDDARVYGMIGLKEILRIGLDRLNSSIDQESRNTISVR